LIERRTGLRLDTLFVIVAHAEIQASFEESRYKLDGGSASMKN